MTEKISFKVLDRILAHLEFISNQRSSMPQAAFMMEECMRYFPENDKINLMARLYNDGYIMSHQTEDDEPYYPFILINISFDGIIFLEKGGYVGKLRKERVDTYLKAVQTWAIAIGTLLAAVFSILSYFNIR